MCVTRRQSGQSHIKGAVALPTAELQAMTQRFIDAQKVAQLPGVSDQRAPLIVYADSHTAREALLAYKELRNWGYGNTTVLKDGFSGWQAAGLPIVSGAAATQIVYEKKLAPGAIAPQEFIALQQSGDGVHADRRAHRPGGRQQASSAAHAIFRWKSSKTSRPNCPRTKRC